MPGKEKQQTVLELLKKRADQVRSATEIIVQHTSDWQKIKQFINNRLGDISLTENQSKKYKRYQYMYNQLVSGKYTENEVINQVSKVFEISVEMAYHDLKCAQELFNYTLRIDKSFELKMELEAARKMRIKCEEIGDFRTAAAVQKNIIAILHEIEDDPDSQAELFEGINIEPVFNPALLGVPEISKEQMKDLLSSINAKRNKKLSLSIIEDLDFEETAAL